MREKPEIFIISKNNSKNLKKKPSSKIISNDPLYLIDVRNNFDGNLNELSRIYNGEGIHFYSLENDWAPEVLKKNDYDNILHNSGNENILKDYYSNEQSEGDYICKYVLDEMPDDIKKSLNNIFDKYYNGWLDSYIQYVNKKSGMFSLAAPKSMNEMIEVIDRYKKHYDYVMDIFAHDQTSNLYTGAINKIDYGISMVNSDYDILYTNYIRRKYHDYDLLGKKCYRIFPYDGKNSECEDCPISRMNETQGPDTIRCEVHKLRNNENNVYFVNETASKYKIYDPKRKKINSIGINVVRINTYQTLTQEYQKILQRLNENWQIVHLLKYALLGGLKDDFEREFRDIVNDHDEYFDNIVEKLSYQDTSTGEFKILNYGFGRFRFYNVVQDIFSPSGGCNNIPKDILQIVDSYGYKENMIVKLEEYIGISIYKDDECFDIINNDLKYIATQKKDKQFQNKINEIINSPHKEKAIEYLTNVGLIEKTRNCDENNNHKITDNIKCHEWYDLPLNIGDDQVGVLSLDWVGKKEAFRHLREELFDNLRELLNYTAHALRRADDNSILSITGIFSNLISKEYNDENDLLYEFSKKITKELNVLKCEVYHHDDNEYIERIFLYYNGLDGEKNKELKKQLDPVNHKVGQNMIGNVFSIIKSKYNESDYSEKDYINRCINVLSYEKYNKYYEETSPNKDVKVNNNYKNIEESAVAESKYLGVRKELKNCLITPLMSRDKYIGGLKITNYKNNGDIYFPRKYQRILVNIASQLAVKIMNIRLVYREENINKIFNTLSTILNNLKGYAVEFTEKDIKKKINEVFGILSKINNRGTIMFYDIRRQEDFSFKLNRRYVNKHLNNIAEEEHEEIRQIEDKINAVIQTTTQNEKIINPITSFGVSVYCRVLYYDYDPDAVIYIRNDYMNIQDAELYSNIIRQIETIFSIPRMQKKSAQIMQNVSHQIISPLAGLAVHCDNLINSNLPEENAKHFKYSSENKKTYVYNLLKSQTTHVRYIADGYKIFLDFDLNRNVELVLDSFSLTEKLINIVSIYQYIAKLQDINNITVYEKTQDANDKTIKKDEIESKIKNKKDMKYPHYVFSDENMIMNIFSCLIDNAIKYSKKKTDIELVMYKDNSSHYIDVNNYGIIIEEKDWVKIFEREYRAPNAKIKNQHGSGIGLYLVSKMVKCLKGEVEVVNSDEYNGTTFKVKLPIDIKNIK